MTESLANPRHKALRVLGNHTRAEVISFSRGRPAVILMAACLFSALSAARAFASDANAFSHANGPNTASYSAYRYEHESFEEAFERVEKTMRSPEFTTAAPLPPVLKLAQGYEKLDWNILPSWEDGREIMAAFKQVRDTRFMPWQLNGQSFPRRSSWMYPYDGCHARAQLAVENVEKWEYTGKLAKVFAFGKLQVDSPNSLPNQPVTWWFHVVPGLRLHHQPFVFDPAIEPNRPMTVKAWAEAMLPAEGQLSELTFAICDADTYIPHDDCSFPRGWHLRASIDQSQFLGEEWKLLSTLQRDPVRELGAFPPWLEPNTP